MKKINSKFLSMLGIAQKAKGIVSGEETCRKYIVSQKVLLVLIAEDASNNTKKRFMDMCNYRNILYREVLTKQELGGAIGKYNRSVVAVIDINFKKVLLELINF